MGEKEREMPRSSQPDTEEERKVGHRERKRKKPRGKCK